MSSLQDQLLKAGLVDQNKAKKASKDKSRQKAQNRKAHGKNAPGQPPVDNAMKLRNAERDRKLNFEKEKAAEKKAIAAQIRQLIKLNRVIREEGDIAFNFTFDKKIKTLHITEILQTQLSSGKLVIVRADQASTPKFEIIPKPVADKIAERDSSYLIHQSTDTTPSNPEDDAYAEFEVPDDLMW